MITYLVLILQDDLVTKIKYYEKSLYFYRAGLDRCII